MIVLKILMWTLIALLGLAIGILLLLLLTPLRYRVRAAKLPAQDGCDPVRELQQAVGEKLLGQEKEAPAPLPLEAEASLSFLARALQLKLGYVGKPYLNFLLFGKEVEKGGAKKPASAQKPASAKKPAEAEKKKPSVKEEPKEEPIKPSPAEEKKEAALSEKPASSSASESALSEPSEKPSRFQEKTEHILDKAERFLDKADEYLTLLADHAEGIRLVMEALIKILTKILPRSADMDLRYGFSDPYKTGRTLAVWSVLAPPLQSDKRRITVEADFEQACLEADGWLEGHFSLGALAAPLLGLVFRKPVRKLIGTVLKLSGKGKKEKTKAAEQAA